MHFVAGTAINQPNDNDERKEGDLDLCELDGWCMRAASHAILQSDHKNTDKSVQVIDRRSGCCARLQCHFETLPCIYSIK